MSNMYAILRDPTEKLVSFVKQSKVVFGQPLQRSSLRCCIVVSLRPYSGDESAVWPDGAVVLRVHAPSAMLLRVTVHGLGGVASGPRLIRSA